MRQWVYFKTAVVFLTRIPVGSLPYSTPILQASARYFSWVGLLVGLVGGAVLAGLAFFFSLPLALVVSMLSTLWLTGSFHEDGLADCCDAFGGGWEKEKILSIMKDSRLGTYGVVGLFFALLLKFFLLWELGGALQWFGVALVLPLGHALSRSFAVLTMQVLPYVQDLDQSKSKPLANRPLRGAELLVLGVGALLPLLGFLLLWRHNTWLGYLQNALVILLPAVLGWWRLVVYCKKWIGGYTGDCLGMVQQVTEILLYTGILLSWRFI